MNWNLNKNDGIYLIIVFLFALLCTAKMMFYCMSGGILNPDIALYLLSGLKYAGLDYFNVVDPNDLFFTPIISFLTSLFFIGGYVDKNAIIFVTSFFSFLGYIGLYILLKNRFNSLLSLTGVIIYGSLSVVILNISRGLIDIPAVSISIWVLVFAIMSIDKNPKYFLITFPLFVLGFFTKYVVGLILPLIFLYYLMNRSFIQNFDCLISDRTLFKEHVYIYFNSKEFKYLMLSFILSLILAILICKFLILDFGGSLTFFEQTINTFNGHSFSNSAINYVNDKSYYFDTFPDILYGFRELGFIFTGLLYVIFSLGLIFNLIYFDKNKFFKKNNKKLFKTRYLYKILLFTSILLIFSSGLIFITISNHMLSNICLLIAFTLCFSLLQKFDINEQKLSLDILFLAYFLINFIFISLYVIKVPRYALPIIPPFIYFIIWGLESIIHRIDNYSSNLRIDKIIPIILIILFLISTTMFITSLQYDRSNNIDGNINYMGFKNDLVDVSDFIIDKDPEYHNKTFASYYHHSRILRWYLNENITIVDDNTLSNFSETNYIILNEKKTLDNYSCINHIGDFYIYHRG